MIIILHSDMSRSYKIAYAPSEDSDQQMQANQNLRCPLEDALDPCYS